MVHSTTQDVGVCHRLECKAHGEEHKELENYVYGQFPPVSTQDTGCHCFRREEREASTGVCGEFAAIYVQCLRHYVPIVECELIFA
ncbi:hypothetical protein TSUD_74400 [Trifolium subterraneum]|nr:hypothetical protein TSUD_74400 [Trifolium subterraneum]